MEVSSSGTSARLQRCGQVLRCRTCNAAGISRKQTGEPCLGAATLGWSAVVGGCVCPRPCIPDPGTPQLGMNRLYLLSAECNLLTERSVCTRVKDTLRSNVGYSGPVWGGGGLFTLCPQRYSGAVRSNPKLHSTAASLQAFTPSTSQ